MITQLIYSFYRKFTQFISFLPVHFLYFISIISLLNSILLFRKITQLKPFDIYRIFTHFLSYIATVAPYNRSTFIKYILQESTYLRHFASVNEYRTIAQPFGRKFTHTSYVSLRNFFLFSRISTLFSVILLNFHTYYIFYLPVYFLIYRTYNQLLYGSVII